MKPAPRQPRRPVSPQEAPATRLVPLPARSPIPTLNLCGPLHHRDQDTPVGQGTPVVPVAVSGPTRTYRLTLPGFYDAMLPDRIVTFFCDKGQLDL